jgi:hypothetical protein
MIPILCLHCEIAVSFNPLFLRKRKHPPKMECPSRPKDKFNNKNFTQDACVKNFFLKTIIKKSFTQPACVKINK